MTTFTRTKQKYGSGIASYMEGITTHSKSTYDCWTFDAKTRSTREKHFKKLFGGPKSNYIPEQEICLN